MGSLRKEILEWAETQGFTIVSFDSGKIENLPIPNFELFFFEDEIHFVFKNYATEARVLLYAYFSPFLSANKTTKYMILRDDLHFEFLESNLTLALVKEIITDICNLPFHPYISLVEKRGHTHYCEAFGTLRLAFGLSPDKQIKALEDIKNILG